MANAEADFKVIKDTFLSKRLKKLYDSRIKRQEKVQMNWHTAIRMNGLKVSI